MSDFTIGLIIGFNSAAIFDLLLALRFWWRHDVVEACIYLLWAVCWFSIGLVKLAFNYRKRD